MYTIIQDDIPCVSFSSLRDAEDSLSSYPLGYIHFSSDSISAFNPPKPQVLGENHYILVSEVDQYITVETCSSDYLESLGLYPDLVDAG